VSVTAHEKYAPLANANGGRARPGLRFAVVVTALALAMIGAGVYHVMSAPSAAPHYTYGGLPSWLPRTTLATHQVVIASASHPQLGIEGDTVKVTLPTGTTTAVMVGPRTPPFVAPPPPATTATITIDVSRTTGTVVLRARDFALLDGNGVLYRPRSFVGGATTLTVPASGSAAVRIRQFMAIGSGSILWAPDGHPVITWEFTVEND